MSGPLLAYSVDTSRWPLCTISSTPAVRDNAALENTYVAVQALLARRERFTCLIDVRGAYSEPSRRKRMMGFIQEHRAALDHYLVATAAVVGSSVERGVVTAALWLLPGTANIRVFTDANDAETWLRSELSRHP